MLTTPRIWMNLDIVNISSYKTIKYTIQLYGGSKAVVTRVNQNGAKQSFSTPMNSNDNCGDNACNVFAWEHWYYQIYCFGWFYFDGVLMSSNGKGYIKSYDSSQGNHTHTVEFIVKS